jgi:hypothetical protein
MNHTFSLAEARVRRRARSSAASPPPEGIGQHAVPAQGWVSSGPSTAPRPRRGLPKARALEARLRLTRR